MASCKKKCAWRLEQPQGYIQESKEEKLYCLKMALYGLKQASQSRNNKIYQYFCQHRFERSPSYPSLYAKERNKKDLPIVCLYTDGLIYTSTNPRVVKHHRFIIYRSRIHFSHKSSVWSSLVKESLNRSSARARITNSYLLRQHVNNRYDKKFSVPLQVKTHWASTSLHRRLIDIFTKIIPAEKFRTLGEQNEDYKLRAGVESQFVI